MESEYFRTASFIYWFVINFALLVFQQQKIHLFELNK